MQPVPLNWESAICEENNIEYFWQKDKRKSTWKSPNETYFKAIAKRIRAECSQMSFNSIEYCFTVRPCLSVVIFYKLSCYLQLEDQLRDYIKVALFVDKMFEGKTASPQDLLTEEFYSEFEGMFAQFAPRYMQQAQRQECPDAAQDVRLAKLWCPPLTPDELR